MNEKLRVTTLAALIAGGIPAALPGDVSAANCQIVLGFRTLDDAIPTVVGDCLDNQAFSVNGDAIQHTTNGLLVWRKPSNSTAFTNGGHTWVNLGYAIKDRDNRTRFREEPDWWAFAVKADASFSSILDQEYTARNSLAQISNIAPQVLTKDYLGPDFINAFEPKFPGVLDPVMGYVGSRPLMEHIENMESISRDPATDAITLWSLLGNGKTAIVYKLPFFSLSSADQASVSLKEVVGGVVAYALREKIHYGDQQIRKVITEYISYNVKLQSNLQYNANSDMIMDDASSTLGQEKLVASLKK